MILFDLVGHVLHLTGDERRELIRGRKRGIELIAENRCLALIVSAAVKIGLDDFRLADNERVNTRSVSRSETCVVYWVAVQIVDLTDVISPLAGINEQTAELAGIRTHRKDRPREHLRDRVHGRLVTGFEQRLTDAHKLACVDRCLDALAGRLMQHFGERRRELHKFKVVYIRHYFFSPPLIRFVR